MRNFYQKKQKPEADSISIAEAKKLALTTPLNKIAPLCGCSYQALHKMFNRHGWPYMLKYQANKPKPKKEGYFDVDFYAKQTVTI